MQKPQLIYLNALGVTIWVSRGITQKEYQKLVKKNLKCEAGFVDNARGLLDTFESDDSFVYWIWTKDKDAASLVHEAIHAVIRIFDNRGIERIDVDNDEFLAYYVDYIVGEVLDGDKKQKKRKRKRKSTKAV